VRARTDNRKRKRDICSWWIPAPWCLIQPGLSSAQTQPCYIKARGVTGTQLKILGEQEVTFDIKLGDISLTFVHTCSEPIETL
jgi:hypothetical protein